MNRSLALVLLASTVLEGGCFLAKPAPAVVGTGPPQLSAQTVAFVSRSGSTIRAWLIRGHVGAGAVLLLHGVGANRLSMLDRARFLHDQGFTVLAPDFQAHGESPGAHITFGAQESWDAAAAVAYLRAMAPAERIGVIGVSMGGAAALLGAGPVPADAFVLESMYPTIRDAVRNRLHAWLGPFGAVGALFAPTLLGVVGPQIGVKESDLQPIERIDKLGAPLLLIAGVEDQYTPLAEAESLFAHARVPKTFWAVPGAGHEDLHAYARAQYEQRVGRFLVQHLRAAGSAANAAPAAESEPRLHELDPRPVPGSSR